MPFPCPKRRFALAALILIWGIYLAAVNSCSSWFARQGALKLFEYDINGAVADFKRSNNIKVSAYCLYQLAELHLADGKPEQTIIYLDELERHCQLHNYLHAQRLRAVAAYQLGDMQLAAIALQRELLNAPFSVISADFQRYLLRAVHAEPSVIDAAEKNFAELCRMRQITPDEVRAPDFITIDDGPFPAEARGVK